RRCGASTSTDSVKFSRDSPWGAGSWPAPHLSRRTSRSPPPPSPVLCCWLARGGPDMIRHRLAVLSLLTITAALSSTVVAQTRPDPSTLIAAQKEAMVPLAYMDGVWRGPAWILLPSGEKH